MKELVVISGKGGTGKTSLTASFAALAHSRVMADCDVDAADLHILLSPEIRRQTNFTGGKKARILQDKCILCGLCMEKCAYRAISYKISDTSNQAPAAGIDSLSCEGCGVCAWFCPQQAVQLEPHLNGVWYVSDTRFGTLVHAKLNTAESNSGKLVTLVKNEAKKIAQQQNLELVIVDGAPGIGCPVIASLSGANLALIVTEPTPSGLHDFKRIADLVKHFSIPAMVCINKYDINQSMAEKIKIRAEELDITHAGNIAFNPEVTKAQINKSSIIETRNNSTSREIKRIWRRLSGFLFGKSVSFTIKST